jgi:hypothetical protein
MPLRRFIPALTTLGVVAGLAAARMVVEVLPVNQTVAAVAEWIHGPERVEEPPRPKIAKPVADPKPPLAKVPQVIEIEILGGTTCDETELSPTDRPSYEPLPTVTNSLMTSHLRGGA